MNRKSSEGDDLANSGFLEEKDQQSGRKRSVLVDESLADLQLRLENTHLLNSDEKNRTILYNTVTEPRQTIEKPKAKFSLSGTLNNLRGILTPQKPGGELKDWSIPAQKSTNQVWNAASVKEDMEQVITPKKPERQPTPDSSLTKQHNRLERYYNFIDERAGQDFHPSGTAKLLSTTLKMLAAAEEVIISAGVGNNYKRHPIFEDLGNEFDQELSRLQEIERTGIMMWDNVLTEIRNAKAEKENVVRSKDALALDYQRLLAEHNRLKDLVGNRNIRTQEVNRDILSTSIEGTTVNQEQSWRPTRFGEKPEIDVYESNRSRSPSHSRSGGPEKHTSNRIDANTPVFGKVRIDIDDWIFAFENACIIANIDYSNYARMAINYTLGLSHQMVKTAIRDDWSWTALKKALQASFTSPDKMRNLKLKLMRLKQEGSFQKFAEEFRQLAYRIGTSEEAMLDMFLDGVNAETRKLLSIVSPKTFEDAMEAAAKINGEEKAAYSINSVQKTKIQCRACKKTGHMERVLRVLFYF